MPLLMSMKQQTVNGLIRSTFSVIETSEQPKSSGLTRAKGMGKSGRKQEGYCLISCLSFSKCS